MTNGAKSETTGETFGRNLNLWPIGNCQTSALIDDQGRFVWGCVPRVDGDPLFCSLLSSSAYANHETRGFWAVDLEDCVETKQYYLRNTPVLVTEKTDSSGNSVAIYDFCPRYRARGRIYRPVAYARIVKPIKGSPRITVRLRPATEWNASSPRVSYGSNHIRFAMDPMDLRLSTNASIGWIAQETAFRVERDLYFFLGPDESFSASLSSTVSSMLEETVEEWRQWVRGLAIPLDWQDEVIRAAITLKLCQHEDTGAIVAALTTSLPEHAFSERNWDYRYCWIRDAYYTVQGLNRIGALDVLEGYLEFLRNIIDNANGGHVQPLYDVRGHSELPERSIEHLDGYRGMGPVRCGNQAAEQIQHDAYGQIVLSSVQGFVDKRLLRLSGKEDFEALEAVGELAWQVYDQPDAGLWELRTRAHVHTYSAVMCWAACDRLEHAANELGLEERAAYWRRRAQTMHDKIMSSAWHEDSKAISAVFGEDIRDASIIQLLDLRFLTPDDPRFRSTLMAVEQALRRGNYMLRYADEDDFGLPETAFNVCTFWLIEALHVSGRKKEARHLFEEMLSRRTTAGLLSEDIDPETYELWGNYPQTYSLVGIINCAVFLSRPWSEFR